MVSSRPSETEVAMIRVGVLLSLLALCACKGKDSNAAASTAAGSASAPIAVPGGVVGIKECDDYITKVNACLTKDPALREQSEAQVKAQTENWKAMAQANKDGATKACKTALDNFALLFPTCK
jgi:hypothetical protein